MVSRKAEAEWHGDLKSGKGKVDFGDGRFDEPYNFASRFEQGDETNPEELLAAAHAACFSMALANELAEGGHTPVRIRTNAEVTLDKLDEGFAITTVELKTEAEVPGIGNDDFQKYAEEAKVNCPVSKALVGCVIGLEASLL